MFFRCVAASFILLAFEAYASSSTASPSRTETVSLSARLELPTPSVSWSRRPTPSHSLSSTPSTTRGSSTLMPTSTSSNASRSPATATVSRSRVNSIAGNGRGGVGGGTGGSDSVVTAVVIVIGWALIIVTAVVAVLLLRRDRRDTSRAEDGGADGVPGEHTNSAPPPSDLHDYSVNRFTTTTRRAATIEPAGLGATRVPPTPPTSTTPRFSFPASSNNSGDGTNEPAAEHPSLTAKRLAPLPGNETSFTDDAPKAGQHTQETADEPSGCDRAIDDLRGRWHSSGGL